MMTTELQTDVRGGCSVQRLVPQPFYDVAGITIYCGDNRQILPLLDDYDLLLTDPPYGLGARLKSGDNGEWSKGFNVAPEWDTQTAPEWVVQLAISKAKAAIIWGGNYYALPIARGWLGWDKMQEHSSGHYELAWTNLEIPTRMYRKSRVESYSKMGKVHPTQKPEELMSWCLNLAPDARTICDPWMGSGTTLVAAKARGLRAIGIEANETYCRAAVARLAQDVLGLENPTADRRATAQEGTHE
jgi:DNA modification methylase